MRVKERIKFSGEILKCIEALEPPTSPMKK
jgi:hypothetical protein